MTECQQLVDLRTTLREYEHIRVRIFDGHGDGKRVRINGIWHSLEATDLQIDRTKAAIIIVEQREKIIKLNAEIELLKKTIADMKTNFDQLDQVNKKLLREYIKELERHRDFLIIFSQQIFNQ